MVNNFFKLFHSEYSIDAFNYLGSFYTENNTTFRVYAPHATSVSVVGEFNDWNDTINPMTKINKKGIWECVITNVKLFDSYKYAIYNEKLNKTFLKQDPYAYYNETDGKSSSKVFNIDIYSWNDHKWMDDRDIHNIYRKPINIYEVHLGSWKKQRNGKPYNYKDLALKLIPYAKKMGYNYIELLPITEHPYLGSWGYQVTGYFSVTSRYGTPDDFMFLVDYAHQNGIGVIMDWVPAHFPKDDYGLIEFDGKYLYEDPKPTRREFKTWGTRIFNYGKPEVKSFLISSANFFLEKYHIDGLRVDAVAAMLYLDYDREKFKPNIYGEKYKLEAIDFLKDLNKEMFKKYRNILMIAEESSTFPKVTKRVEDGGLGFNYKWCMGWMNDTLEYMRTDPYFRWHIHNKMTFTMSYLFEENYFLPLSHDEVVHLKNSLIGKMFGDYDMKFSSLKAYMMYMMTHPGKKLNFMGNEIAQFEEWDENKAIDWFLLKYPKHKMYQKYVKDLNHRYLNSPSLYEIDDSFDGFEWIIADDATNNVYVYSRKSVSSNKSSLIVILNFSGIDLKDYMISHESFEGEYLVVMNSDEAKYGGVDILKNKNIFAIDNTISVNIPKLSGLIIKQK